MPRTVLKPDRVRRIDRPFGWIPQRLITEEYWGRLSGEAKLLYCLLCIVSDRQGISFYSARRLGQLLALSGDGLREGRAQLIEQDLVAFEGRGNTYQVLSLPTTLNDDVGTIARGEETNREREVDWQVSREQVAQVIRQLSLGKGAFGQ